MQDSTWNASQTLQQADRLQQLGRLTEAERLYLTILAAQPKQPAILHRLGVIRHQQGRNREALRDLDASVRLRPQDAMAWANLGLVQASLGRLTEAVASYDRALALRPEIADVHNRRGNALKDLKRPAEAVASYERALALDPGLSRTLNNRGAALLDLGRPEAALESFDAALARDGDHLMAMMNRGLALQALSRHDAAVAAYDRVLAFKPNHAEAYNNRGNVLRELGRPTEALANYDKALALNPDYAEAHNNRGVALKALGRPAEALACYNRALSLAPDYAAALNNRANTLRDLNRRDEALADVDRALAEEPDFAEALDNRANILCDLGRHAEALADYERALEIKPDYAEAWDNKGVLLKELGRLREAAIAAEKAIALAPTRIRSYYNLAEAKRLDFGDPHFQAMEALSQRTGSLTADELIDLHYALGKALADMGETERSFQHVLEGSVLQRARVRYDERATLVGFERTRAAFTGPVMRRHEAAGDPSATPVFIIGMPRSGTTLVEQILASHPEVFAAGETADFVKAMLECGMTAEAAQSPEIPWRGSAERLRALGAAYVGRIAAAAPHTARITNKTPENFRYAGLIRLALPNARIIHVRRDPVDTCLSCFTKLFTGELPYSYDLAELGRYYRAYAELMTHWRQLIGPDLMVEVDYEELVGDLEGQARRIVAHCGLDWNARCLDFHLTERPVRTASAAQVRQPLFTGSIGRWRPLERFLTPLLAELGPLVGAPHAPV